MFMFKKENASKPSKYALTAQEVTLLHQTLQKHFTEAGVDLNDPTNQELFTVALQSAIEQAQTRLKETKTRNRDMILITLTTCAASAATYFLAPISDKYRIPATVGVAAAGVALNVARATVASSKVKKADTIAATRIADFTIAMGIVASVPQPAPAPQQTQAQQPTANTNVTTEAIVAG